MNSCLVLVQVFVVTKCDVCSMVLYVADFVIKSSIIKCKSICHLFAFCVFVCISNGCVEYSFCQISFTAFLYPLS